MKVGRAIVSMDAVTQNTSGDIAYIRVPLTFMFDAFMVFDNETGKYMSQVFDNINDIEKFRDELKALDTDEKHDYIIRKI